jgi:hypothetical protein
MKHMPNRCDYSIAFSRPNDLCDEIIDAPLFAAALHFSRAAGESTVCPLLSVAQGSSIARGYKARRRNARTAYSSVSTVNPAAHHTISGVGTDAPRASAPMAAEFPAPGDEPPGATSNPPG